MIQKIRKWEDHDVASVSRCNRSSISDWLNKSPTDPKRERERENCQHVNPLINPSVKLTTNCYILCRNSHKNNYISSSPVSSSLLFFLDHPDSSDHHQLGSHVSGLLYTMHLSDFHLHYHHHDRSHLNPIIVDPFSDIVMSKEREEETFFFY